MTYREEIARLTAALRQLLVDGGTVPAADLPAAVAGHASLISMLVEVHGELTDRTPLPRAQDVSDLEKRPVALLGRLLKQQPSVTDQPFSDVLQSSAEGPAGKLWREVAKTATLAQYEWQRTMPDRRPVGDAAWSEIADIAYLSEAAAVLDSDIADSLAKAGRIKQASEFRRAGNSGLRVVARTVQHIAESGPLPKNPDLQLHSSTRVLVTATPAELPEAFERLTAIVRASDELTPAHVAAVSRVIAEATTSAAATLQSLGDHAAAAVLRDHAAKHAQVPGLDRRVAALAPDDGKAAAQAQVIHDLLGRMDRKHEPLRADVARSIAAAIPELTQELSAGAERQLETVRWIVPLDGGKRLGWGPAQTPEDRPQLATALRSAEAHSRVVQDSLTPGPLTAQQAQSVPRLTLPNALNQHPANERPPRPTSRALVDPARSR